MNDRGDLFGVPTPRQRVERVEAECAGVWSLSGITSWEREFLASVKTRTTLSERQEELLVEIERKAFE